MEEDYYDEPEDGDYPNEESFMEIKTFVTGACTTASIGGVSGYGSPQKFLDAFIAKCVLKDDNPYGYVNKAGKYCTMDNVYVFSASEQGRSYKYGTVLAKYIEDYGLGKVVTTGAKINAKYHPDRTAQTWLWSPDQKALEAWYEMKEKVPQGQPVAAVEAIPKPRRGRIVRKKVADVLGGD